MSRMIGEDVSENRSPNYLFVYSKELPSLQQMASYRICQEIWLGYISPQKSVVLRNSCDFDDRLQMLGAGAGYQRYVEMSVKSLKTARRIEEMLKKDMIKILDELAYWAEHLGRDIFPDILNEYMYDYIDINWCAWLMNGEVDYLKSAQNMLNSGKLNEIQKFVVMSFYCMGDAIENLSVDSLPDDFNRLEFHEDPLLFFWLRYMKNELQSIPIEEDKTLYEILAECCYGVRRTGLKYFWSRLTPREKLAVSIRHIGLVRDQRTWCIVEQLLASFSTIKLDLPENIFYTVLIKSSIYSSSSVLPLMIWDCFKDRISNKQFENLFSEVFKYVISSEDRIQVLNTIWDSAYDHHKNHVAQKVENIVNIFAGHWESPCVNAFELLYQILSLQSANRRSVLVKSKHYADGLFFRIPDVDSFRRLFALCIQTPEEQTLFKKTVLFSRSEEFAWNWTFLMFQGSNEGFSDKIEWLFSNAALNVPQLYHEKVIMGMLRSNTYEGMRLDTVNVKWNSFTEDSQSAPNLTQKSIIESYIKLKQITCPFHRSINLIKTNVEAVIRTEELKNFKAFLLDIFCKKLQSRVYWWDEEKRDEMFFQDFVEWCCDYDKRAISKFKENVSYGIVFDKIFGRLLEDNMREFERTMRTEILLARLQKYLKWYLGSYEKVNEYKCFKIHKCSTRDTLKIFHLVLQRKNDRCLEVLLRWFFNSDELAMQKFRSENLTEFQ